MIVQWIASLPLSPNEFSPRSLSCWSAVARRSSLSVVCLPGAVWPRTRVWPWSPVVWAQPSSRPPIVVPSPGGPYSGREGGGGVWPTNVNQPDIDIRQAIQILLNRADDRCGPRADPECLLLPIWIYGYPLHAGLMVPFHFYPLCPLCAYHKQFLHITLLQHDH